MSSLLITGGPVHSHLDAVKIVTNKFKGGLMSALADQFVENNHRVIYLCNVGCQRLPMSSSSSQLEIVYHDGFEDYFEKVLSLAGQMDGVILGAAVANLIVTNPWKGKFPSHNYKPGDVIPIEFTIAPRVIDKVKAVMKKGAHLFGFKLLSGVPHSELIDAAYKVVLNSRATAVFANDAENLQTVYAVTKERAEHQIRRDAIPTFVNECIKDVYYQTRFNKSENNIAEEVGILKRLLELYKDNFVVVDGQVFGAIAVRCKEGFVTTSRGKSEIADITYVQNVDHDNRVVTVSGKKASLNSPLFDKIFERNLDVKKIIHLHVQLPGYPTYAYAPPGTVRDTFRETFATFNIENHGCVLMLDENGHPV